MPLQNRVTPFGEIVAHSGRGLFMGNRGILHDAQRRLGRARWRHPNWVTCTLAPRGRPRVLMSPGSYTELFFLDEAVALAAGHRPCALCRRSDYRRFQAAWAESARDGRTPSGPAMDRTLHAARIPVGRAGRTSSQRAWGDLPDGSFVVEDGAAWLLAGSRLMRWTMAGYDEARTRPGEGVAEVLTPEPTLAVLSAGYRPLLHPTADR